VATYFRPPTYSKHFDKPGGDSLWSWVPYDAGLGVLNVGGVCTPFPGLPVVDQNLAAAADHVYLGGYVHGPLSAPEIASLLAAGYGPAPGPYLSTTLP
jgi:hypothetical protein